MSGFNWHVAATRFDWPSSAGLGDQRLMGWARWTKRFSFPLGTDIGNPSFFVRFLWLAMMPVSEEHEHARLQKLNPDRHHARTMEQRQVDWTKPPLRSKHVWAIRTKLQLEGLNRDLALFNLAIDRKLRGCDVMSVKVEDVAPNGYAIDRATVRQKKTGHPVRFEITEQTRQSLDEYIRAEARQRGDFLFQVRNGSSRCLTTRQYARLVSDWIGSCGLDPSLFGTHSLRRTKATMIYKRTGNLRAVQLLFGHTKIESMVRYLGIEIDAALEIAEQVDI